MALAPMDRPRQTLGPISNSGQHGSQEPHRYGNGFLCSLYIIYHTTTWVSLAVNILKNVLEVTVSK
jgi:hypothetical protein